MAYESARLRPRQLAIIFLSMVAILGLILAYSALPMSAQVAGLVVVSAAALGATRRPRAS